MTAKVDLQSLLSDRQGAVEERLALFAWLNLGILESLSGGLMTATDVCRNESSLAK